MDGIVIQLQEEALKKDVDILTLTRKAYLIARKLKLKEFEAWINCEQSGYSIEQEIPDYRKVVGEVKAWNPYHGWIPVVFEKTTPLHEHDIRESLSSLVAAYKNSDQKACLFMFSSEINAYLSKQSSFSTKFSLQVSVTQIYSIIEQVRNKILDWAITLEENEIVGEGLRFTPEEKDRALNEPLILNYTNNFFSDVMGTQIQQGTKDSYQKKE